MKVLLLDDAFSFTIGLRDKVNFELITEMDLGGDGDVYFPNKNVCERLVKLTENDKIDIIVVGNNRGAGVPKARLIPEFLKNRTIVIWFRYSLGDEYPYAQLGFSRFCLRDDLNKVILKMISQNA